MAPETMDHYPLTDEQRKSRRKAFTDSIDTNAVCRLASRYNNSKPCRIFQDEANGSFNVCFFVEFPDDNTRWVVRIPIEPAIHNVWDKVQSEVATMRYIESSTTIPLPGIRGFGRGGIVDEHNPTGHTYLILDYVPGQSLDIQAFVKDSRERRNHFYSQLIDILAQLRQQEFDHAGSLMPDPDGGPSPIVGHSLSIELNELQIEQGGSAVPTARFASAIDFAFHRYHVMAKAYQSPMSEISLLTAQLEVFGLNDLKGRIFGHIDPRWNHGPFILAHADLRWSNIIVDDDLNIRGIIDWEWTGTLPRQFFMPPTWIAGLPPDWVAGVTYWREYREFYRVLSVKGTTFQPCRQLADEWGADLPDRLDLPMAITLQHHGLLLHMYYRGIFPKFYNTSREETVKQFLERDGEDGTYTRDVRRRLEKSERYTQYLKDNNLFVPREVAKNAQENLPNWQPVEKLNAPKHRDEGPTKTRKHQIP